MRGGCPSHSMGRGGASKMAPPPRGSGPQGTALQRYSAPAGQVPVPVPGMPRPLPKTPNGLAMDGVFIECVVWKGWRYDRVGFRDRHTPR